MTGNHCTCEWSGSGKSRIVNPLLRSFQDVICGFLRCGFVYSLQVVGEAQPGHVFGEVGVLCYRPQLFTVRTKRLSQLLRLNRTAFLNLVQANVGDGAIIMNNLLQVGSKLFIL